MALTLMPLLTLYVMLHDRPYDVMHCGSHGDISHVDGEEEIGEICWVFMLTDDIALVSASERVLLLDMQNAIELMDRPLSHNGAWN